MPHLSHHNIDKLRPMRLYYYKDIDTALHDDTVFAYGSYHHIGS